MEPWEVAFWVAVFLIWLLATMAGLVREAQAVPLLGAHHGGGVGTGAPVPDRLTVASPILDPAATGDPGALSLELVGHVVLTATPDHAGYTYAEGRVQMRPPSRSADIRVGEHTLLVVPDRQVRGVVPPGWERVGPQVADMQVFALRPDEPRPCPAGRPAPGTPYLAAGPVHAVLEGCTPVPSEPPP